MIVTAPVSEKTADAHIIEAAEIESQPQAVTEVIGVPSSEEGKAWTNAIDEAYLEE